MKTKVLALVLSVFTLGTLLPACGFGESSEEAKADYCNSLSDLSSTVMSYEGLDPRTATNDELDQAADDIEDAWNEVVSDAEDWANAYDNELAQAHDDLYWAIQAIPGDYTIAQSLAAVEEELSAFPDAFRATFDGTGCSSV
jgi:inorganic triphosphatase YgiF